MFVINLIMYVQIRNIGNIVFHLSNVPMSIYRQTQYKSLFAASMKYIAYGVPHIRLFEHLNAPTRLLFSENTMPAELTVY